MTTALEATRRAFRAQPHDREILRLAVPALGALVAEPMYRLADTAVVGHLGTPELAGLAVANTVLASVFALFIFLAYGTTSAVSRLIGAGEDREAAHQAVQSLWLALGLGVTLAAGVWATDTTLVGWLGASGEVADHALTYLRISLFGLPATFLILAGTGYLRGLQDTRTPLVVAVGTALVNLVVELVLIVGLDFGIGASAASTVLAEAIAASVYVTLVGRAVRRHGVRLAPDGASLRRLGRAGADLFLRTAALRGSLTIATAVAARIGTDDLAAHQVAFEIWMFLALALDAIAIAGQALIGRLLGAGQPDAARAAGRRMLEWGLIAGVAATLLIALLRLPLATVFSDDGAVVPLAAFLLWWVAALQPINGLVFVLDGVLIGAGDLRFLGLAMVGAALAFLPAAAAVLVFDLGVGWLWAAIGVLMVARLAALLVRFRGERWLVTGAG